MRDTFFFLFIIFLTPSLYGQWTNLNSGISGDLNAIYFENATTGIVAGETGVYKTTNGGLNWSKELITNNPSDSLLFESTHFQGVVENFGNWFAAGKDSITGDGVVFKQIGTSQWELSKVEPSNGLFDVGAFGSLIFAVGEFGTILYTLNSGLSWDTSLVATTKTLRSFDATSTSIYIGGDQIALRGTSSFISSGWTQVGDTTIKDLKVKQGTANFYGVNSNKILHGSPNWLIPNMNFNGPLDGTCISFHQNNEACVGTENGIFRSTDNLTYWEYLPSSANFHIRDIQFIPGSQIGYAAGPNGLVIKTSNQGGSSSPYIQFESPFGACIDSTISFFNSGPASYSYTWEINNTPFSSQYHADTAFNALGSYSVKLVGSNGTLIDSLEKVLPIVQTPDSNKTISVSDTLICKSGFSNIYVHQSDTNIQYQLYNLETHQIESTVLGNGDTVTLVTDTLTDSTSYRIIAKSVFGDCQTYLPQVVLIGVEKTKAIIHSEFINAALNEPLSIFNNSTQASSFSWSFGNNASQGTSNALEPQISYNQVGPTDLTLIATSLHGCSDTLNQSGPYIYDPQESFDNCWAINFEGDSTDRYGQLREFDAAKGIETTSTGDVLAIGNYSNAKFLSKAGDTSGRFEDEGFYIARYSPEGVLKWLVRGIDANPMQSNGSPSSDPIFDIKDIAVDENDNILVVGKSDDDLLLYSNDGTTYPVGQSSGFLIKLKPNGIPLWDCGIRVGYPTSIATDTSGSIHLAGAYVGTITEFSNSDGSLFSTNVVDGNFISKISEDGTFQWISYVSLDYETTEIDADGNGNTYVAGGFDDDITITSANAIPTILTEPQGTTLSGALIKFDTTGDVDWTHTIWARNHSGGLPLSTCYCQGLKVNDDGDSFITLSVNVSDSLDSIAFPSATLPTIRVSLGDYAIASYDSDGNFRWANGSKYSWSAHGGAIAIDESGFVYTDSPNNSSIPTILTSTDGREISVPKSDFARILMKYDHLGRIRWANLHNNLNLTDSLSTGKSDIRSLAVDDKQNLYFTGIVLKYNSATKGYFIAGDELFPDGYDPYIAKFSQSGCLEQDSITLVASSGPWCEGDTLIVSYIVSPDVIINTGNVFKLEISDRFGNFDSTSVLNQITSDSLSGTISAVIPNLPLPGDYFVRIKAENPLVRGNSIPLNLNATTGQNVSILHCQGDTASLNANWGFDYDWAPTIGLNDPTSRTPITSPAQTTTYYAFVQNYCGTIIDTFTVLVAPKPTVSISSFAIPKICLSENPIPLPTGSPSGGFYSGLGVVGNKFDPTVAGLGTRYVTYSYTKNNICTISDSTAIEVLFCNGFSDFSIGDLEIKVSPNPVRDRLLISIKTKSYSPVSIQLYDTTSKMLHEQSQKVENDDTIAMDLSDLSSGVYYLRLTVDSQIVHQKIIIQ